MNSIKKVAIYAPDTNFFIQCKDAAEIDWPLVNDAEKIVLVVLNEVHREIDRLKSGGNTRRARRAKVVSSQLRSLIVASQEEVELRAAGPAVSLTLAPRLGPNRVKLDDYDSTSADERIAEEAKACSEAFFNGKLILLSHDGMPLRAAQLMGVQACPVPDAWLLPPEPTDQDRAIQKLSERLAALEKQGPAIDLRLENDANSISGTLTLYPSLSGSFIEGVMDALKTAFPIRRPSTGKATSAIENMLRGFEPTPTEADIREREAKYNDWAQKVEDFIGRLPNIHNLTADGIETVLVLSNSGSTPAEHLVVDISAVGSIRLQEPVGEDDRIEVPAIPSPPQPRLNALFGGLGDFSERPAFRDHLANLRFGTPRVARNRHEFYWDFAEPGTRSEHCRGECEDFRHGLKDERIQLVLTWAEPKEGAITGAIKVVVSARNMPAPVEKTIPVRLDVEIGNSEDLARSIVLEDLGVSI